MGIGLNKEDYKLFVNDAMQNSIVVGGICNNACIFCSCKAQKAACRKNWTNYISIEDLLSVIDYIDPNKSLFFGEGPSFLSCEPFQHPQFLDLLKTLNLFFPNKEKFTTTIGKNIPTTWYETLRNTKMKFVVSVNTFDREEREDIMRSPDDFEGLVNFLKECPDLITKTSFLYNGNLDGLKRSLDYLYNINPVYVNKKVSMLRLTDYSIHHNKKTEELFHKGKETWNDAVMYFDQTINKPSYWLRSLTDFSMEVKDIVSEFTNYNIHSARRAFKEEIEKVRNSFNENMLKSEEVVFLLPESSYYYFEELFPELNGILVKNLTFKGSYTAAGLLTKNDIFNAVLREDKYKYYVVPKAMLNKFRRDIHGNHIMHDYPFNIILP